MTCMTKPQFDAELEAVKAKNQQLLYRREIRKERFRYFPKFVMPSTSKLVLIVSALLCVEVLAFCQYMIWLTGDTSTLYAMVGSLFTFMGVVLGYFVKATKENSVGGITYESAMAELSAAAQVSEETAEAVG